MSPVLDSSSPMPGRSLQPWARSAAGQWLVAGIASLALHAVALVGLEWTAPWWREADRPAPPAPRLSISLVAPGADERARPAPRVAPPAPAERPVSVAKSRPPQRTAPAPARAEVVARGDPRRGGEIESAERIDVSAGPPGVVAALVDTSSRTAPEAASDAVPDSRAPSGAPGLREGGSASEAYSDYFDGVFASVMSSLDYPRRARLEQVEGVVVLSVHIDRDGAIERCEVSESSGSPLLDRHAIQVARRAAPFGPVPASFRAEDLVFLLPVEFAQVD